MIKCPNCGSTTQMKYISTDHPTSQHSIEKWRCLCGCIVERQMKEQDRITTFPNGGIKYEKGE